MSSVINSSTNDESWVGPDVNFFCPQNTDDPLVKPDFADYVRHPVMNYQKQFSPKHQSRRKKCEDHFGSDAFPYFHLVSR